MDKQTSQVTFKEEGDTQTQETTQQVESMEQMTELLTNLGVTSQEELERIVRTAKLEEASKAIRIKLESADKKASAAKDANDELRGTPNSNRQSVLTRVARQPVTFSDSEQMDPLSWFRQMKTYLDVLKVDHSDKVLVASTYLGGAASLWVQDHLADNWDKFTAEFKLRFVPLDKSWINQMELLQVKYDAKKGLDVYVNELKHKFNHAADIPESSKVMHFSNGLPSNIMEKLLQHNVTTLEQAIIAVAQILAVRRITSSQNQEPKLLQLESEHSPNTLAQINTMMQEMKTQQLTFMKQFKSGQPPTQSINKYGPCTHCGKQTHSSDFCWFHPSKNNQPRNPRQIELFNKMQKPKNA